MKAVVEPANGARHRRTDIDWVGGCLGRVSGRLASERVERKLYGEFRELIGELRISAHDIVKRLGVGHVLCQ